MKYYRFHGECDTVLFFLRIESDNSAKEAGLRIVEVWQSGDDWCTCRHQQTVEQSSASYFLI